MIISFIGSGQVGRTLSDLFAKAGHKVILTNSCGKKSLERTVITLGKTFLPVTKAMSEKAIWSFWQHPFTRSKN